MTPRPSMFDSRASTSSHGSNGGAPATVEVADRPLSTSEGFRTVLARRHEPPPGAGAGSAAAAAACFDDPRDASRVTTVNETGIRKIAISDAARLPPITTVPISLRASAPDPDEIASGV